MSKDGFLEKFGPEPRKDDLTILCSKQDDPTDQAQPAAAPALAASHSQTELS